MYTIWRGKQNKMTYIFSNSLSCLGNTESNKVNFTVLNFYIFEGFFSLKYHYSFKNHSLNLELNLIAIIEEKKKKIFWEESEEFLDSFKQNYIHHIL